MISGGSLSQINITNPGTGYTSVPTITLAGGGGSGQTLGTVLTVANTSGGLTKIGLGTLTLSSSGNTYTGITTVQQGTLKLGVSGAIASAASPCPAAACSI